METTTAHEMKEAGAKLADSGKPATPFNCREVDARIFSAIKGMAPLQQAKTYNLLRGAFNAGWQARYFQIVSA